MPMTSGYAVFKYRSVYVPRGCSYARNSRRCTGPVAVPTITRVPGSVTARAVMLLSDAKEASSTPCASACPVDHWTAGVEDGRPPAAPRCGGAAFGLALPDDRLDAALPQPGTIAGRGVRLAGHCAAGAPPWPAGPRRRMAMAFISR